MEQHCLNVNSDSSWYFGHNCDCVSYHGDSGDGHLCPFTDVSSFYSRGTVVTLWTITKSVIVYSQVIVVFIVLHNIKQ